MPAPNDRTRPVTPSEKARRKAWLRSKGVSARAADKITAGNTAGEQWDELGALIKTLKRGSYRRGDPT